MGHPCHMLLTKTSLRENFESGQGAVAEAKVGQTSISFKLVYYSLLKNQVGLGFSSHIVRVILTTCEVHGYHYAHTAF